MLPLSRCSLAILLLLFALSLFLSALSSSRSKPAASYIVVALALTNLTGINTTTAQSINQNHHTGSTDAESAHPVITIGAATLFTIISGTWAQIATAGESVTPNPSLTKPKLVMIPRRAPSQSTHSIVTSTSDLASSITGIPKPSGECFIEISTRIIS